MFSPKHTEVNQFRIKGYLETVNRFGRTATKWEKCFDLVEVLMSVNYKSFVLNDICTEDILNAK